MREKVGVEEGGGTDPALPHLQRCGHHGGQDGEEEADGAV